MHSPLSPVDDRYRPWWWFSLVFFVGLVLFHLSSKQLISSFLSSCRKWLLSFIDRVCVSMSSSSWPLTKRQPFLFVFLFVGGKFLPLVRCSDRRVGVVDVKCLPTSSASSSIALDDTRVTCQSGQACGCSRRRQIVDGQARRTVGWGPIERYQIYETWFFFFGYLVFISVQSEM